MNSEELRPLQGIRVLELAMYHAAPGGGALLADLGAEVIKVERPGIGDPVRRLRFVGKVDFEGKAGANLWHEIANRGKKGICVDLTQKKGRGIVYRLVKKCDIFLTSWRSQALERMEMTYDILRNIQPELIYARVSGYGPSGPEKDAGAFDFQSQARAGMMYSVGESGTVPLAYQFAMIDQITSIMASHEVITALFMRERTGIGQEVHVSLLSSAMCANYPNIFLGTVADYQVPPHIRAKDFPLRNHYRSSDESWFIVVFPPESGFEENWSRLCKIINRPDLEIDKRFNSVRNMIENSEQLVTILDETFAKRSRDEWLKIFNNYDIPVAPVNMTTELKKDPQILDNDYLVEFEHPRLGRIKIPGYPVHFSIASAGTTLAAPNLGEHTEYVLSNIGEYSMDEINQFSKENVIQ